MELDRDYAALAKAAGVAIYLRAPAMDHFGVQVASLSQLEAIVDRARQRRQADERVTLIDVHARTTQGPTHDYTLTSAYIGFVMPLLVELQHLERHERPGR